MNRQNIWKFNAMTNGRLKLLNEWQWSDDDLKAISRTWYDPDLWYMYYAAPVSFIYFTKTDTLYCNYGRMTHSDMLMELDRLGELQQHYDDRKDDDSDSDHPADADDHGHDGGENATGSDDDDHDDDDHDDDDYDDDYYDDFAMYSRRTYYKTALIGRTGITSLQELMEIARGKTSYQDQRLSSDFIRPVQILSFWNEDARMYRKYLYGCVVKLIYSSQINYTDLWPAPLTEKDLVSTPYQTTTIGTVLRDHTSHASRELSPKEKADIELMRQLHLLRGGAKKAALNALGLGGGGKKHPWQAAAEKHGVIKPGQKWWAMHSEGAIDTIASMVTEDPDIFNDITKRR